MKKLPLVLVSIGIIALLLLLTINFKQQSFNIQPTTVTCSLSESNPTCTINIFAHDPVTITGTNFPPNSNIEFTGTICGVNYTITTGSDSSGSINTQRTRFITTPLYQLCSNFNGATTFSLSYSGLTINGTLYEPIINVNGVTTHVLTQGQKISAPVYATTYSSISGNIVDFTTYASTTAIQVLTGNNNLQVQVYSTRKIYQIETTTSFNYFSGKCGKWIKSTLYQTQPIQSLFYTKSNPSLLCLNPCDFDAQLYSATQDVTTSDINGNLYIFNRPVILTNELPQPIGLNIGNLVTTVINFYQTNKQLNPVSCTNATTISQVYGILPNQPVPTPPPSPGQQYVTLKINVQGQT